MQVEDERAWLYLAIYSKQEIECYIYKRCYYSLNIIIYTHRTCTQVVFLIMYLWISLLIKFIFCLYAFTVSLTIAIHNVKWRVMEVYNTQCWYISSPPRSLTIICTWFIHWICNFLPASGQEIVLSTHLSCKI